MKLYNIKNLDKLFEIVDNCDGEVHLISVEGDDIVLTSKLSRFIIAAIREKDDYQLMNELEIKCDDPNDVQKFIDFMINE